MRADSVFPDKDIVELQFEIEWAEGITRIGWGKIGGDTVESVAPVLGLPFASRCGTACGVSVQTIQKCSNLSKFGVSWTC